MTFEFLKREYVEKGRSTYDIAKELGTYPNAVRRALIEHGIKLRSKRDAQLFALSAGRGKHPTLDKLRSDEERERISEAMAKHWSELSSEERNRRLGEAQRRWKSMSTERREKLRLAARKGLLIASRIGSKLELYLERTLTLSGFLVERRATVGSYRVDLFLPQLRVCIDVNGPAHFLPVWSEETLAKTILADECKANALLQAGFVFVVIKNLKRDLYESDMRKVLVELVPILESRPKQAVQLEIA